jgi:predicted XRE-type DNA-binding protein
MKFNLTKFKQKLDSTDLSYAQISSGAGITRPWLKAVISGRFNEPNPEWIDRVEAFIKRYEEAKF